MLTDINQLKLAIKANEIRQDIIKMLEKAGSGHSAGSLGMADVFTLFYFHILKHNPHNPDWDQRDLLVLSNGHICPVQYAAMAHAGYFPKQELASLRRFGSRLQGHPHREFLPGIEVSSGPLGSGLAQAVGMAYADKFLSQHSGRYVYCFMGDGELNEGVVWESAMQAGRDKLGNLIGIIDRNNIQIDGYTYEVLPLEPLKTKWESFGFHVIEASGHDFSAMEHAIFEAKSVTNKPSIIIAHTIAGKGVSFMENKPQWHGKAPDAHQAEQALSELRKEYEKLQNQLQELQAK